MSILKKLFSLEEGNYIVSTLKRAFILFGFTFFSTYVAGVNVGVILKASFLCAGLYFFTELMRHYSIKNPSKNTHLLFY